MCVCVCSFAEMRENWEDSTRWKYEKKVGSEKLKSEPLEFEYVEVKVVVFLLKRRRITMDSF